MSSVSPESTRSSRSESPLRRPGRNAASAAETVFSPARIHPVGEPRSSWTFLTNHTHVLLCLSEDPTSRLRDVAERVGITERAVQRIVAELETAGILRRVRVGRRNEYTVDCGAGLRHPLEQLHTVGELLELLRAPGTRRVETH